MRFSLLFILGLQWFHQCSAGTLGVNLGFGKSSQPYGDALNKLKSQGVTIIKTFSINPDWLNQVEAVYAGTNVDVTVAIPNGDLNKAANDQGYRNWVLGELKKHKRVINFVAIGNEPFHEANRGLAMPFLSQAYKAILKMIADNGLQDRIKVTIPFSADIFINTYPVENTVFHPNIIGLIRDVAGTMQATGSKFSINLYTYFAYTYSNDISLDFALGRSGSLFEAMLRGCRVALNKIGANNLRIIVGETGWPSEGGSKGTTVDNLKTYTEHVTNFVRTNSLADTIYLFEVFDESEKPGASTEKHFGISWENRWPKFDYDIASDRPCTQWGWRFYDFVDITGADIGVNIPAGHRNNCQQLCQSTGGCKSYTWYKGTCYLKKGGVSFKPCGECYSAIAC